MDAVTKSRHARSNGEFNPSKTGARPIEANDDYPHIMAMLDANTRVIECADGIQWIIQKRCNAARWPWRNQYFCRTKEGLLLTLDRLHQSCWLFRRDSRKPPLGR
jgi:hypothetical protein